MYAPVILFVYNRPIHTRQTVEALLKNDLAADSDLVIFSDAPKRPEADSVVCEVRTYIRAITGFKSVRVVEREKNWGLANSIINGVTTVMSQYGRVIVLEDDLVTSPHFLEYMNAALDHYERDPKAFSIGGYNFPQQTMSIPSDYAWDTYASFRCCSWGWATWADRWKQVEWDMKYYETFMQDCEAQKAFNRGGLDMTQMLKMQYERRIDSWAIRFCYAHHANDMHCIYPVKTLVMNIGQDHSGTHCGVDPRREHALFDEEWNPFSFCPADVIDEQITRGFYNAYTPLKRSLITRVLQRLGL